jgi:NAD(P)-dependent dehydrogenase (short-subunit alcohol dehydrogenase family)
VSEQNKTVIITGGASGIGKSLAFYFGNKGDEIVIGDVEELALYNTIEELESKGISSTGMLLDVSDIDSFKSFAREVFSNFSPPYVLCLNAGVGAGGSISESSILDWEWVLGVNLWGVINGLNAFLPELERNNDGHLVFTSSIAGHLSYPNMGPYNASKHAVLTIAETLHYELLEKGSKVGVSVLCPGLVKTNILDSDRNRPEGLTSRNTLDNYGDEDMRKQMVREIYDLALHPDRVAELVFNAVDANQFYIFTDNTFEDAIKNRHRNIETATNPTLTADLVEEHLND